MSRTTKKKQVVEVKMHQHENHLGKVFGGPHPIDAEHQNKKTQKFHDGTVKGFPNKARRRT